MTRLSLLAALPLMLMLQGCDPHSSADLNDALNALEGRPLSTTQLQQVAAFVASSSVPDYSAASDVVTALIIADTVEQSSSSSSAEQVAYVPPPEECAVSEWRGIWIDCHGFNVPEPQ